MAVPAERLFALGPDIDDGIRGEGLVLESVPSPKARPPGHGPSSMGTWDRWANAIPMLIRVPGRDPYVLSPKRWMTRAKYPVAGTALPVTVDRNDPSSMRIEWDEVEEIDGWIAAGHTVFTDPDTVETGLREAMQAHRDVIRGGLADQAVETMGPGSALDAGAVHEVFQRLGVEADAESDDRPERMPGDRPSARILAATPWNFATALRDHGEMLLSVAVPGARRYGLRWRGRIPEGKLTTEWSDVPVSVDARDGEEVEVLWDEVPDAFDAAAERLHDVSNRLADLPAQDAQMYEALIDAIPDPTQRAQVRQQISQATQFSAPPDPAGQIERLKKLHDAGALSEAEFAAAKARVLDQM